MFTSLKEHLTFNQANIVTEAIEEAHGGKSLYMKGILLKAMYATKTIVSIPKKKFIVQ